MLLEDLLKLRDSDSVGSRYGLKVVFLTTSPAGHGLYLRTIVTFMNEYAKKLKHLNKVMLFIRFTDYI